MRLYGRRVSVTVIGQRADTFAASGGANTLTIDRLRIRFDVKKDLGKQPNQCVIKINGLSETTRSQLEVLPLRVLLHAGYEGATKLLFDGDLKRAQPYREGPVDIATELKLGDGHRGYANASLVKSYKTVTLRQIVSDCATSMGLAAPREIAAPAFSVTVPEFASSGPTREALTDALGRFGYSWSTQNRQLVVLTEAQVRDTQEVLVNAQHGLVGSPKYKTSEKAGKGTKTEVSFSTLLYPDIVPGGRVRLESQFIRQVLKVTDVSHKGDTHSSGEDFVTDVVGRPL